MNALHSAARRARAVRVAVLDRHPVARAGFDAILRAQPGLAPAGAVADEHALWPLLYRARPEVVVLEHRTAAIVAALGTRAGSLEPRGEVTPGAALTATGASA